MKNFKLKSLFLSLSLCLVLPVKADEQKNFKPLINQLKKLAKLESSSGGRIGLSALNTADGRHFQYRAEERFPLCSTFKAMVIAAILKKSMTESQLLKESVSYKEKDIEDSGYSPITKKNLST